MIVHFVVDEKIIDQIIDNFLEISEENMFLVFTENFKNKFTHITRDVSSIRRFDYNHEDINEVLKKLKADAIIVHQLNLNFAKTINQINKSLKIAWIEWGFDMYHLPKIRPTLYAPITKNYLLRNEPSLPLKFLIKKNRLSRNLLYKLKNKNDPYKEIFRAIRKINFFSTYIKEDFNYFMKFYNKKHLSFSETAFSTIDQYLAGNKNLRINEHATNIIVGNSNTIECNYLDVICELEKRKDKFNKAYFVLSYGKNDSHKKEVITKGKKNLVEKFHPLTDFMPREKYIKMLQSCSVGIFNHYRQQAMGNIIALLYMGARVYLSEKNPAYHYFLRKGIAVNSFENEFEIYTNTILSSEKAENNRRILDSIFSKEKVVNDLRNLTAKLLG